MNFNTDSEKTGRHVQNLVTVLDTMVNMIGEVLYDLSNDSKILHFDNE